MNTHDKEIGLTIKNKVTNLKKLQEYSKELEKIKDNLKSIPTNMKLPTTKDYSAQLDKISKSLDGMKSRTDKFDKSSKVAFSVGRVMLFANSLKRVLTTLSRFSKKSMDYVENINLYQVAFDGAYESADRFINKTSEMYGLDESQLTKTVGIFKQLTNAMNIATDTGEKLSTLLTQMSIDISSLYNVNLERAQSVLQSALSGQTRPVRSVTGADVTISTLQQELDSLNINTYINNLSYAEKRLLIVISLTKQLSEATNDFGRTIESPANQTRILYEQWQRFTRALGNLFLPILTKILPYLNAILMVLTEIINTIASLFGFKLEDFDYFGDVDKISNSVGGLSDNLLEAEKSAQKLKRGLRGFDKLNVITTPSSGSSGSGGRGGIGGINPKILEEFDRVFANYNKRLEDVRMKATDIRDRIMEWLGFTKLTDEKTGDISFKFEHITGGTVLGALAVGGVIYKGIKLIYNVFKKLGLIDFSNIIKTFGKESGIMKFIASNPKLVLIIGSIGLIIAGIVNMYKNNEEFRNSVNKLWKILKDLYNKVVVPLANILKDILEPILGSIKKIAEKLYEDVIKPLMPLLEDLVNKIAKDLIEDLEKISEDLDPIITLIQWLWRNVLEPFFEFVIDQLENKIIKKIEAISDAINVVKTAIDEFKTWWNKLSFNKKSLKLGLTVGDFSNPIALGVKLGKKIAEKVKDLFKEDGGIYVNKQWKPVTNYATGGLPPVGQMFVARENGPELVGNIGGHTAIMNNDQIVASVSDGVARAVSNVTNGNGKPQVFNIYLDKDTKVATYVLDKLDDMARQNGEPIIIGG